MKFKYPQQFFLSLLKMTRHEPDPMEEISKIQKEFAAFNMKLLPPHMIKSEMDFSMEADDIRFGLLSIKGISDKSIENSFKLSNDKCCVSFSSYFSIFPPSSKISSNNSFCIDFNDKLNGFTSWSAILIGGFLWCSSFNKKL